MAGGRDDDGRLARVAKALKIAGVPLRLDILLALARSGILSPSRYVAASDGALSLREASYHFRYLRDAGLIVLDHVETGGGTAQHFYDVSPLGAELVRALPALERAAR
ncbi:MAG TPA: helix-turn-helix transcriptional regulator [Solirubrobacteraceae bacterium]|jgi:DNA-binding transcriptional ArsR family regulator